jgi:hypothetical protein
MCIFPIHFGEEPAQAVELVRLSLVDAVFVEHVRVMQVLPGRL